MTRVTQRDKAEVADLAVKFDYDYWDGSRETGYGGYKYDGRWRKVADAMVENLMYWQLTCRAFHTPEEWDFVFKQTGYTGDHEFIFFE
jgi:hypothetical protein